MGIPEYLRLLNDRQREAAETTEGPLIVLAGAGSGKTRMLTARIAHLIEGRGVVPHQILAVTFTNKAANEMRERISHALAQSGALGQPEVGTFHSICIRILRREMDRTPFTQPFVVYDDSDQLSLVKAVIRKLDIDSESVNAKSIQGTINRMKCDALGPEEMRESDASFAERQLKRIYTQYQADLFANNAVDFGEILAMTYRIFRDHPDVRARYQARYRKIHVDEYQDTNRVQYLILSMLASPAHGGHGEICVVGDEDQSIYKWRGADIGNILSFEEDYPGAKVVKLEQNYRSTRTIITAASQVIANNTTRREKTLWTENEEGEKIERWFFPDERAEAESVIREIKRMALDRDFREFAIFYRTNAQSRQFEDALRRDKIPYQIYGGLRFYDRAEIKDVMAYFRVILNPADSVSLRRIINVPGRGIGKTTIEKVETYHSERQAGDEPLLTFWECLGRIARGEAAVVPASAAKKIGAFVGWMRALMEQRPQLSVTELFHRLLDATGYVRELKSEGTEEALARIENLEEFDSVLQEFKEDHEGIPKPDLLPLFIEQTSLAADGDQNDRTMSAVQMMTLHSSKGLEFPVVFLVGVEEGLFPSLRPWEDGDDAEEIEEERRLCYVGMTRARKRLFMTHVQVRRLWGQITYQEPARFFHEFSDDLTKFKNFVGGPAQAPHLGKEIRHPEYGSGVVVSSDGSGDDTKVTVRFKGLSSEKRFLWKYLKASQL